MEISKILNHNFIEEVCAKHNLSSNISPSNISIVLEINSIEDDTLKSLLDTIKQLKIKTMHEVKSGTTGKIQGLHTLKKVL